MNPTGGLIFRCFALVSFTQVVEVLKIPITFHNYLKLQKPSRMPTLTTYWPSLLRFLQVPKILPFLFFIISQYLCSLRDGPNDLPLRRNLNLYIHGQLLFSLTYFIQLFAKVS